MVYRNEYGWKVPSLPARVIRELGYNEPAVQRVLLFPMKRLPSVMFSKI